MNRLETTFADLRDGDVLIDKSGGRWHVSGVDTDDPAGIGFWLCDPITKVRLHHVSKQLTDLVTVERVETHADQLAALEAGSTLPTSTEIQQWAHETAVSIVDQALGGEVVAEVTAEQHDAAVTATEEAPVTVAAFASMTDLEQQSHLYILHPGLYLWDLKTRAEREDMHSEAHRQHEAGTLKARLLPHRHEVQ